MPQGKFLFTSEAVSKGHPDKLADQISDGILDAIFEQDPMSRVACETMVTTGVAIVAGEITTKAVVDYSDVVRKVIHQVGYTDDEIVLRGVRQARVNFIQKPFTLGDLCAKVREVLDSPSVG